MSRFVGIDFSGAIAPWRPIARRPTVWIAVLEVNDCRPSLANLMPVHDLAGADRPFFRLATFLGDGKFDAAAIDAPFSLPQAHLPPDGHGELLHQVRLLPNGPGRDFPEASSLINLGERYSRKTKLKPLRLTEQYWARRGISVRSTMWAKPRGGAPFAAACLRLLDLARRPIWPWADAHQTGMLVEAFPAAQLHEWGLPHQGYSAPFADRDRIVRFLRQRLVLQDEQEQTMRESADALDSVIAAFAAFGATRSRIVHTVEPSEEGLIAVADLPA